MKKVIFYGISASATQIYKDILEQMGINMMIIGDDCLSKRFKQVLNMQESTSEVHEKYDGSYLLMRQMYHLVASWLVQHKQIVNGR